MRGEQTEAVDWVSDKKGIYIYIYIYIYTYRGAHNFFGLVLKGAPGDAAW